MDESGIDMGFDLAALVHDDQPNLDFDSEFEQTLSLLSSSQDLMYYELKSRAPVTNRCVCAFQFPRSVYSPLPPPPHT